MNEVKMDRDEMIDSLRRISNPLVLRDVCSKIVPGLGLVMCREWVEWPTDPRVGDLVWVRTGPPGSQEMTVLVWDGRRWV